jgi:GDPmannose 4,6-dehydratase
VISSQRQLDAYLKEYKRIFPAPKKIPELPVNETNPLRPMSPYAVTKVYGEYITLNYHRSYGLKNLVMRAFNHEGARRGMTFVTSAIARQVAQLRYGLTDGIRIGNVNAFRDWSHVDDIVEGYSLAALKGEEGDVYNLGSERANSVLTYLLWALEEAGYTVDELSTSKGTKKLIRPAEQMKLRKFDREFDASKVDSLMLEGDLDFSPSDEGIKLKTKKGTLNVEFDQDRFRPAEVPLLLSDTIKAKQALSFSTTHSLRDIIVDQLNYYTAPERR